MTPIKFKSVRSSGYLDRFEIVAEIFSGCREGELITIQEYMTIDDAKEMHKHLGHVIKLVQSRKLVCDSQGVRRVDAGDNHA